MTTSIFIEGRRDGYTPQQVGRTYTARELIEVLEQFNEDTLVYIQNDNGYTFGEINDCTISEGWFDEDDWQEYDIGCC